MIEKMFLSSDSWEQIRDKSVPEPGIHVIDHLCWHTDEVVDLETRTYDEAEGDDPMLAGQACTKKPKNLTKRDIEESDDDRFKGVEVVSIGMGRYFDAAGVKIHLISAKDGPEGLRLGGSGIQSGIVSRAESTEQMFATDGYETKPDDVLVMFSRDLSGLGNLWVGRRAKGSQFAWLIELFDRGDEQPIGIVKPEGQKSPGGLQVPDVRLKTQPKKGKKGFEGR